MELRIHNYYGLSIFVYGLRIEDQKTDSGCVNGQFSQWKEVKSSVSQGCVLGLVLFNLL